MITTSNPHRHITPNAAAAAATGMTSDLSDAVASSDSDLSDVLDSPDDITEGIEVSASTGAEVSSE